MKDRADLLEALIGAVYVDKDLSYCKKFAEVCFFPRLTQFIVNQEWNDPKSKLQQCCLTLRGMEGGEPDIPVYKVNEKRIYGMLSKVLKFFLCAWLASFLIIEIHILSRQRPAPCSLCR